ncbi:Uncharacterised protein [Bordetella pertussis]|nr:Uncharacterised protein [Bordetella pertussis]
MALSMEPSTKGAEGLNWLFSLRLSSRNRSLLSASRRVNKARS